MTRQVRAPSGSPLAALATLRECSSARISSWDRTGGNADAIKIEPGATAALAEIQGAGCIRHIWFTINCPDPNYLRKLVLRMFWDGEQNPSVETPVGDFFGVGHALTNHFVSLPLSMIKGPGWGRAAGMNCYFPMPFASKALITVENQSQQPVNSFYYYIDHERYDAFDEDQGRFHACYNQETPCRAVDFAGQPEINLTGEENYVILDAQGRGHYVGCVLSVDNFNAFHQNHTWFGEGDDMIFVDGEKWPPSLHGTGTEDYFCEAWGFPSGEYSGPYTGVSLGRDTVNWSGKWSLYRFHIEDPVHFRRSIRVTIEHGHANDQGNDYSSVAYWYQEEPHRPFRPVPAASERVPRR
jgi:hypothetical protein